MTLLNPDKNTKVFVTLTVLVRFCYSIKSLSRLFITNELAVRQKKTPRASLHPDCECLFNMSKLVGFCWCGSCGGDLSL